MTSRPNVWENMAICKKPFPSSISKSKKLEFKGTQIIRAGSTFIENWVVFAALVIEGNQATRGQYKNC